MLNKIINQFLGYFDVMMIRKATLRSLTVDEALEHSQHEQQALAFKEMNVVIDDNHKQLLRHQLSVKWDLLDQLDRQRIVDIELKCPICEHSQDRVNFNTFVSQCIFEGGTLVRHQCPECELIFGAEKMLRLSEAELAKDYEWHYRVFSEGDSTAQELRAFYALHPEKDRIYLNWGSGAWSNTLSVLREEGWNVYGYEPHSSAMSNSPYIISSIEQLKAMSFDGIFSNNVLEHLRYPVRELLLMRELLNSNGKMSHATPCFEYLYEFTRFHLFFYLGRSRTLLTTKAKLSIIDFVVDGDFMNMILIKG